MSSIEVDYNNVLSDSENVLEHSTVETTRGFIRVGAQYQAVCTELQPENQRAELREKAVLVWAPTDSITDKELEEYIALAKGKHGYTEEQALGLLRYNKYDLKLSAKHLTQFTPVPDGWSIEDAKLFKKTLHSVGRDFRKIKEVLPHKSICCLVEYFYKRRSEKKAKSAYRTRVSRKRKEAENSDGIENDLDLICGKAKKAKFS
ncbi:hypothetical protein WA026_017743 [Henosepilachna vigintioctopunctata]|uniref:ELM2 domain-containing protein n=1 Tax=Henosepilachna vigintioctopunctata TaxID=420089 RepID=A0AAW1U0S1_9CUCU